MARNYFYQESTGSSTTTNSGDQTKVTLIFTPTANTNYLYIWSAQIQAASTTNDVRVNLKNGATVLAEGNIEDQDTTDWHPVSGLYVEQFGSSPSSQTLTVNYSAEGGNSAKIQEARIIVIQLTSNDAFVNNSGDQTNTTTTFSTATTLNWTPSSAGDYLLLGAMQYRFSATGEVITRIVHSSTSYGTTTARPKDTLNYYPGTHAVYLSSLSGSQSATMEWARSATAAGTAYCRNSWLVALRISDFGAAWQDSDRARVTTTSNTPQTKIDVATTVVTTKPVLVLAACVRDHNGNNNSAQTLTSQNTTALIAATEQEPVVASTTIDLPMGMWCQAQVVTPVANDASYQLRYYSETNGTSTGITDAMLVVLQFEDSGSSGQIKVWTGSAWVAKPLKVWSGSAWVTNPLKYWNGSSWITTTY